MTETSLAELLSRKRTMPDLFPEFRSIDLSSKQIIEEIARHFPPYSDFNFTSLWSWDTKGEMRFSILNGNLVIRFADYVSGEPFYSFLGVNNVSDTAEALLDLAVQSGFQPHLKLIPEIAASALDRERFIVTEDRDSFDYILRISELMTFDGSKFTEKRKHVNRFLEAHSNFTVTKLDLCDEQSQRELFCLEELWISNKLSKYHDFEYQHERAAIQKFFAIASHGDFITTGVYVEDRLVGFAITEPVHEKYVLCHFSKTDVRIAGICAYLTQQDAKNANEANRTFLNCEQDLGIPNLRQAKNSLRPCTFLKKYTVTLKLM